MLRVPLLIPEGNGREGEHVENDSTREGTEYVHQTNHG